MATPSRRSSPAAKPDVFPALSDAASPILSVDRALRLLVVLADYDSDGAQLGVLAARVGEDKANVHRSLNAMKHRFFVAQLPDTGNYALGPAALSLADQYLRRDGIRPALHRALVELSDKTDETANAAVPEGRHVRFIDKVEPDRTLRMGSSIGARYPMQTTALGRAMLSVDCTDLTELSNFLGTNSAALWPHIESAIERGFSMEHEENESNVSCVGVPIIFGGRAVAAVSISGPSQRMVDRVEEYGRMIHEAVAPQLPPGFTLPELRV